MHIKNSTQRKVASWLNTHWDEVIDMDSFVDVTAEVERQFQIQIQTHIIATIMYAIAGTRDSFEDVPLWNR